VFQNLNAKWSTQDYGIKIGNKTINNLCFADDIILVAKSPSELQQMLEDLHSMSKQIGLKMNRSKIEVMITINWHQHSQSKLKDKKSNQCKTSYIWANFSHLAVILNSKSKEESQLPRVDSES